VRPGVDNWYAGVKLIKFHIGVGCTVTVEDEKNANTHATCYPTPILSTFAPKEK
jgi:hypothetical protein